MGPLSSISLRTSFRMSFVEFFSLGSAASARHPIANRVPTSEANNDGAQNWKKFSYEVKHFESGVTDAPRSSERSISAL